MLRKFLVLLLAALLASCSGVDEDEKSGKLTPGEVKKLQNVSNSFKNALLAAQASELIWAGTKSLPIEIRNEIERSCTKMTSSSGDQITVDGGRCPIYAQWSTVEGLENHSEVHFYMEVRSSYFLRLVPIRSIKFNGTRLIENRSGKHTVWSSINGQVAQSSGERYTFESNLEAPVNSRNYSYRFNMFFEDRTIRAVVNPGARPEINGEKYHSSDFELLIPIIY